MKRNILLTLIVVAALLAVVGYAFPTIPSTMASVASQPKVTTLQTANTVPQISSLSDLESQYESIYTQVNPSVVMLQVTSQGTAGGLPNLPFNHPQVPGGQQQQALGSGFVWDTQGDIVTNNHVIDGATQISVVFSDGTTTSGKVVGADPDSDLAVVKVNMPASELHPVQMADPTQIKVGQIAVAIGNPYGEQNTMTAGIISALGRSQPVDNGATQGPTYTIPDVIQTDAPINPGNSGGVLLNANGQVVGVTQSIESQSGSSAGIGFAIPGEIVQKVIPALISSGHYDHPYIGISGTSMTSSLAQAMNLNASQRGALVATVVPGGPAEKAGLQGSTQQTTIDGAQTSVGGDVITAIDGQPIKSFDDLTAYLARSTQVGQTVTLTILRHGQQQTVKLTLGARPASTSTSLTNP
ncbi:MAG: trypsin-like peptidase domain-containing protein [Chloroflexi bacterium]|nr:trypsin-like peptidase domain-containing protein [Chloroflexota bacterium]